MILETRDLIAYILGQLYSLTKRSLTTRKYPSVMNRNVRNMPCDTPRTDSPWKLYMCHLENYVLSSGIVQVVHQLLWQIVNTIRNQFFVLPGYIKQHHKIKTPQFNSLHRKGRGGGGEGEERGIQ